MLCRWGCGTRLTVRQTRALRNMPETDGSLRPTPRGGTRKPSVVAHRASNAGGWSCGANSRRAGCARTSRHARSGRKLKICEWRPTVHWSTRSAGRRLDAAREEFLSITPADFGRVKRSIARAARPAPSGRGDGYGLLVLELGDNIW